MLGEQNIAKNNAPTMLELIGNTPTVYIDTINNNRLYAKLEYYNPTGSIKDRAAYYLIKGAVARGEIAPGGTIIEPTSGNTGIGLAMIANQLGYKVILTMPSSMSVERRQLVKALGARIVLTDSRLGMQGAIDKAIELRDGTPNSYIPMQFDNQDGALAHYETTAPEIFGAVKANFIVAGVGSGGTVMGIKRYITDNALDAKIVAVEPSESPLLQGGKAGAHGIQGIGANFIPKLVDVSKLDIIIGVTTAEAMESAKALAAKYGILSGISGGASFAAAVKLTKENDNKDIVFIIPDNALKYLSNNIYG